MADDSGGSVQSHHQMEESAVQFSGHDPGQTNYQSLQRTLQLALKEQEESLREKVRCAEENKDLLKKMEQLRVERDRALESLNGERADKSSTQDEDMNGHVSTDTVDMPEKLGLIESEVIDTGTDKVVWETHRLTLERIPGFGFGIAVAGGRDNPHFSNGDPSIAISDVLKAGPAENKLQINDRVSSVNGTSLESVEHADAIRILKECGNQVELVVRRKLLVPNPLDAQPTKVLLQKKNKRDDYGLVIGCKFYVKEILPNSLASFESMIKEGDTILKLNNINVESISLQDARRQLEKSKEKLLVTLKKPPRAPSVTNLLHKRQNSDLDYTKFQPYKTDNMYYLNSSQFEKAGYVKPSINSYVNSSEFLSTPYRAPDNPVRGDTLTNDHVELTVSSPLATSLYYESRDCYGSETRYVSYNKEGGAGLSIAGGNHTGIYIAGVLPNSPAQKEGVREGDEVIKIDGQPTRGMTREEAVLKIMNLELRVDLVLQNRLLEFRRVLASTGTDHGDLFHIRTHMMYNAPKGSNHLSFQQGNVFKVFDTLRSRVVGEWNVIKLTADNEEGATGVIPNKARAEALRHPRDEREKVGRGSLFRKKSQKRSKSLGRDHWEDVIFAKEDSKYEAYERVMLRQPGFMRPIVIYGGLSDIAHERLLKEVPESFEAPPSADGSGDDEVTRSGILKLGCIRSVVDLGKHCVLDVVPSAVDKLNYAQYYPIVIHLKSDNYKTIKELRQRHNLSSPAKAGKKLFEQTLKIDKNYPQIFTKEINLNTPNNQHWFTQLREVIAKEQVKAIWMSEYKPTENMADDFLFPMANQLSFVASPESDMDVSRTSDQLYSSNTLDRHLSRASSDPNIGGSDEEAGAHSTHPSVSSQYSKASTVDILSLSQPTPGSVYNSSTMRSHYAATAAGGQRAQRERLTSDSKLHYHSSQFNGHPAGEKDPKFNTVGRGHHTHHPHSHRHKTHLSDHKTSSHHYMSPRSTTQPHDHKFTRMSSAPAFSKPAPPVRTDSMGSGESPYARLPAHSHRRVHHSMSMDASRLTAPSDTEEHISRGHYDTSSPYAASAIAAVTAGRSRRPSGPTSSHYNHPQSPTGPAPHSIFTYGPPSVRPRTNGHYAASHLMSPTVLQTADDNVFHASPVSAPSSQPSSFSNQLYMDSKEASTLSDNIYSPNQQPRKSTSSFENYKKFVTNTPFYGSRRDQSKDFYGGRKTSDVSDAENAAAGMDTSFTKNGSHFMPPPPSPVATSLPSTIDMEPTPDNHILLDTKTGVFDSSGGILSSESTGVSLYLPPNAIPHGVSQSIYFKVCKPEGALGGPLDQEKGETQLSPLVLCGPQGLKFQLPVELRLPHTAGQGSDSWNFTLKSANHTSASSQLDSNWQSVSLDSHQQTSDFVPILVDHF